MHFSLLAGIFSQYLPFRAALPSALREILGREESVSSAFSGSMDSAGCFVFPFQAFGIARAGIFQSKCKTLHEEN